MRYRRLGRTNLQVSELAFGAARGAMLIALLAAGDLTFGGMLYSDARPFSQRTTIYLINALAVVAFVGKLALGTGLILVARAILRKASQNQAVEATT